MNYDIQIKQKKIHFSILDFFKKCPQNITHLQTYYPIMDDYLNLTNSTKYSSFNNRYVINSLDFTEEYVENEPINLIYKKKYKSQIYDKFTNTILYNEPVFFKISSILCPFTYIKDEYSYNSIKKKKKNT